MQSHAKEHAYMKKLDVVQNLVVIRVIIARNDINTSFLLDLPVSGPKSFSSSLES